MAEAYTRERLGPVVDVWAQLPTERFMAAPWLDTLLRWTGSQRWVPTAQDCVDAVEAGGVDLCLLSAWGTPDGMLISNDDVAATVAAHPNRFRGLASVDLRDPMGAVREIRQRAQEGFVGVRVVPWVWDRPPSDSCYYPVYVACIEAGLPFCTQLGHTGPLCPSEPGRPFPYLDRVLLDFPELVIVGGHVGVPWVDEVISLATKYPNLYIDTSAYVAARLPTTLVEYMVGRGSNRVMFGTNWPMLDAQRCLRGLDDLGLPEDTIENYLHANAARVFDLHELVGRSIVPASRAAGAS